MIVVLFSLSIAKEFILKVVSSHVDNCLWEQKHQPFAVWSGVLSGQMVQHIHSVIIINHQPWSLLSEQFRFEHKTVMIKDSVWSLANLVDKMKLLIIVRTRAQWRIVHFWLFFRNRAHLCLFAFQWLTMCLFARRVRLWNGHPADRHRRAHLDFHSKLLVNMCNVHIEWLVTVFIVIANGVAFFNRICLALQFLPWWQ